MGVPAEEAKHQAVTAVPEPTSKLKAGRSLTTLSTLRWVFLATLVTM